MSAAPVDATENAQPVMDLEILSALRSVVDPELGIDVVSLGLVYEATREGGQARVVMTMTSPACPMGEMIVQDARDTIESLVPGVRHADIVLVYEPRWTPDRMTAEAKQQLGYSE